MRCCWPRRARPGRIFASPLKCSRFRGATACFIAASNRSRQESRRSWPHASSWARMVRGIPARWPHSRRAVPQPPRICLGSNATSKGARWPLALCRCWRSQAAMGAWFVARITLSACRVACARDPVDGFTRRATHGVAGEAVLAIFGEKCAGVRRGPRERASRGAMAGRRSDTARRTCLKQRHGVFFGWQRGRRGAPGHRRRDQHRPALRVAFARQIDRLEAPRRRGDGIGHAWPAITPPTGSTISVIASICRISWQIGPCDRLP